jgi:dipeptidase E
MRELLLVSTSTVHGTGYLDHAADEIRALFGSGVRRVLFVPYALADRDAYATKASERFSALGYGLESIHSITDARAAVLAADAVFIGGGNTFRLVRELQRQGLIEPLRERALGGMPYLGTSAGSNVACPTLKTTNDMPIVQPESFGTLDLVPFQINPHFVEADPRSTHMGETRETRIAEFHEENTAPVIGLREGAMLRVSGERMDLRGTRGARLFQRGKPPEELALGADLSWLLAQGASM